MATPAASAWHRRRDLSQRISSTSRATLTTRTQSFATPVSHFTSRAGIRDNAPSSTINANAADLFRQPSPPAPPPSSSTPAQSSLHNLIRSRLTPFMLLSQTSFLHVFIALIFTLSVFHIFRVTCISTFGRLFLRCQTSTPSLSPAVPFFGFILFFPLFITMLATHSVLSIALSTSPPAKRVYFLITFFSIPLHALAFAYILYGPSLSPHRFFCSAPLSLFPSRNALFAPLTAALLYPFVLHVAIFRFRFHTALPYPFPRSPMCRLLPFIRQAFILSAIPAMALFPFAFLASLLSLPERSYYAAALLAFSRTLSALNVAVAAILPHALVRFYELGRLAPCTTSMDCLDRGITFDGGDPMRIALSTNRSDAVRAAFVESARKPDRMMQTFPPFTDHSSMMWRTTLDTVLVPLAEVAAHVRTISPRATQGVLFLQGQHSGDIAANNAGRPGPSGVSGSTTVPELHEAALRESISISQVLANVFEASVKYDSFGVVLPTLAPTLALLVMLHEGLSSTLQLGGNLGMMERGEDLGGIVVREMAGKGASMWLLDFLNERSQGRALRSLKDSVSICIYRLVYCFREQVIRFVEGREVGWDNQANVALKPFLEFSV